ncbi:MAG: helix-turn-helix domain-containing protein [Patescibacteria group bacterium]
MKEQLREFGFSEKEASVYLALIGLTSAVASDVAKKSKVNRSTTYVVLESLVERGLVDAIERRGVRIYKSAPPEKLVEYLTANAKKYEHLATNAKKLMPELKAMHHPEKEQGRQPKVQFFEGKNAVQSIYEDTLSSLEGIRAYASVAEGENAKRDSKVQIIFPNTKEAKLRIQESKEAGEESVRIPSGKVGFSSEINVYDNRVIFITPTGNFGFMIESKEFADTLKRAFVSARKEAAKLDSDASGKLKRIVEGSA